MGALFNPQIKNKKKEELLSSESRASLDNFQREMEKLRAFKQCSLTEFEDWFDFLDGDINARDILGAYTLHPCSRKEYHGAVILTVDKSVIITVRVDRDYSVQRNGPLAFYDVDTSPLSFISKQELVENSISWKRFKTVDDAVKTLALFCRWVYLVSINSKFPGDIELPSEDAHLRKIIKPKELKQVAEYLQSSIPAMALLSRK